MNDASVGIEYSYHGILTRNTPDILIPSELNVCKIILGLPLTKCWLINIQITISTIHVGVTDAQSSS